MSARSIPDYTLIRSDRKTLVIEMRSDGTLLARAPRKMPKHEIDAFLQSKEAWIVTARQTVQSRAASPYRQPITEAEAETLYRKGERILRERIPYWSAVTGLTPTGFRITHAEKRFGSCSGKNALCFALRLFRYPDAAIDYVILHELAHIRHHNHSRAFYALISAYMPDYKTRESILRQ